MKKVSIALTILIALVAPSALACEKCEWDKYAKVYKCKSGVSAGVDYCWGGFNGTEKCETGGVCEAPQSVDPPLLAQEETNGVLGKPADCTSCDRDAPSGGFVLLQ